MTRKQRIVQLRELDPYGRNPVIQKRIARIQAEESAVHVITCVWFRIIDDGIREPLGDATVLPCGRCARCQDWVAWLKANPEVDDALREELFAQLQHRPEGV